LKPFSSAVVCLLLRVDAQTAAAVPFHPRFVKYVQSFGVLRFMGWMEANTNQVGAKHGDMQRIDT
jgi:hypothetical protein